MSRLSKVQRTIRRRPEGERKTPVVQRNGWEQQAEEAATRFVRNRHADARWLSPAIAARYRVPSSPGIPLPWRLRSDLERAFDADLREVRIHRDAAASAAARCETAIAFAAGRDIFFDQSAPPFDTAPGRELLAHEIAHVLQQTGRSTSGGRIRATAAEGSGEVQRKGEGSQLRRKLRLDFDKLVDAHRSGASNTAQFDELVAAVRQALGGRLDEASKEAADFEAAILRSDPKLWKPIQQSEAIAGLVFDVLKFTDQFAGAAVVLEVWRLLQTYAPLVDVANYYVGHIDKNGKYFDAIATEHELLSRYWPNRFYDTFKVFLFGPTRAIPTLRDNQEISYADGVKEYFADEATKPLADNELVQSVVAALTAFNSVREKEMEAAEKQAAKTVDKERTPIGFRLVLCTILQAVARNWKQDTSIVVQRVGNEVEIIAQEAIQYWKSVLSSDFTFVLDPQPGGAPKSSKQVIPKNDLFTKDLPKAISAAASVFFSTKTKGVLPKPNEYASKLKNGVAGLKKFNIEELELKLIQLVRHGEAAGDFAISIGLFLLWFQEFFHFIGLYDPKADTEFEKKFGNYPDVRFAHRLEVAQKLASLVERIQADAFPKWKALRDQAAQVSQNIDEGRSRLAIVGEWKPEQSTPIGAIATDFSKGFTRGIVSPLSAPELANIYLLFYFRDLTKELRDEVANADLELKDPIAAMRKKSVLHRATDLVDARSRPTRYVASDWDYADNPTVSQTIDGKTLSRTAAFLHLVQNHPKTVKLELDEKAKGREILWPDVPYSPSGKVLFLWSIPDPKMVFGALHGLDELNKLIAKSFLPPLPLADVKALPDDKWIALLAHVAGDLPAIVEQARADLVDAIRLTVSHERRLVAKITKIVLARFRDDEAVNWEVPLTLLERIKSFYYPLAPMEDRLPQLTALLLAIGTDLQKSLGSERRFNIITGYYGFLRIALAGSEGARLKDLERVVPDKAEREGLLANRDSLVKLLAHFDERRAAVQERFGLRSDGKVLRDIEDDYPVETNAPFRLNGERFTLLQVFKSFRFNRAFGYANTPSYRSPMMDGKGYGTEFTPTGAMLFHIQRGNYTDRVTDKDVELLDFYADVIEQHVTYASIGTILDVLPAAARLAVDIAEHVPGIGPEIKAARVTTVILQFFFSEQFREIIRAVGNDPGVILQVITKELLSSLSAENLVVFVLFPSLPSVVSDALDKIASASEKQESKSEPTTVLEKLIAIVHAIGRAFVRAWDFLKNLVRPTMRNVQNFVLTHPLFALLLDLIADHIQRLNDLRDWLNRSDQKAAFDAEIAAIQREGLKNLFQDVVASFVHLQLPQKVVPTEKIILAMFALVASRMGVEERAFHDILEKTGLLEWFIQELHDQLIAGTMADPNEYWREYVARPIQSGFDDARDRLAEDVFNFITNFLNMEKLDAQKDSITIYAAESFPESDLFPNPGMTPAPEMPVAQPGSGTPLPGAMRADAESRFGHDFSHVRLHTGSEGAAMTEAAGAYGLTTGSHVFLNPFVPMASSEGRHVLHHELAHVLQQTGSRPLGSEHSATPTMGREGGGIRFDTEQESAAERTARTVRSRHATEPVNPGPSRNGGGYQPIIGLNTVRRLLRKLTDIGTAKEAQREIERRAGAKPDLEEKEIAVGESIWRDTRKLLTTAKLPDSQPNLQEVETIFRNYFNGVAGDIGKVVPQIAFAISEPVKEDKDRPPDEKPSERKRKVNPKKFAGALEDYLLARSGIVTRIKLDKDGNVASVDIKTLLLSEVGAGHLWDAALSRSGITTAEEVQDLQPLLRAKLRELSTKTTFVQMRDSGFPELLFVWESKKFAFHRTLLELVREQARLKKIKGQPDDLPPVKRYLAYDDKTPDIGLRVGKYGDSNHRSIAHRDSHHTTQFLLIEYFRNKSSGNNQPFPKKAIPAFTTLGVKFRGNEALRFEATSRIEFEKLGRGDRGDEMPAILIARPVHQKSNLHVSGAEADDFAPGEDGRIPVTQGEKVHEKFLAKLKDAGGPPDPGQMDAHIAKFGADTARDQLFNAVQGTYGWMHQHMLPALEKALRGNERNYYDAIVREKHLETVDGNSQIHPDYDLQPDAMERIYSAALKKNDEVMEEEGWVYR